MLAYSIDKQGNMLTVTCSDGGSIATDKWVDVANFLLEPTDMSVVYNVDEFVEDIASTMDKTESAKLLAGGRIFSSDRRKLYYQPNRVFGINQINFYGLSRYASNGRIADADSLLSFGKKVVNAYKEGFGVSAEKLSSPVAVFSEVFDKLDFPRACDLPDEAMDMVELCSTVMTREWRDVYKLGHWEAGELYDYDISSGYPYIVAGLPDISNAKFFTSKTMPSEYSWGELHGKLKITKHVSPFICPSRDCYGTGEWEDTISTEQLWLLNKYGIGEFDMEYGHFYLLPENVVYPFKNTMDNLYKKRSSPNPMVAKVAKGISVGFWGKFAEVYEDNKLGDNFNSIYARMTTSRCLVKVAAFIYHNKLEDDLVSVLVDGCLATKRLPVVNRKVMGSWRISEPMPALVMSLLYQWMGDKKPGNMDYTEIMKMIGERPETPCYGEIDMNLLEYKRHFNSLPKTGRELLSGKYTSEPYSITD